MADYGDSKGGPGQVFLDGSDDDSAGGWSRSAPLITPEEVRRKHLFGIPLVSGTKDPVTKRAMVLTPDDIRDKIDDSVAMVEAETGLVLFPTQFEEKHAFDVQEYQSFGYFRLKKRPVTSIERMLVTPSNDIDVYEVPLDWVETANLHMGQVNIIPLTIALSKQGTLIPTSAAGGAVFLAIFGYKSWIPAFWKIKYTAGFPSAKVPKVINELIGTVAAMEILSQLAATYAKNSSGSLSIDGLSQSVSTPGPEIFTKRLKDLADKRLLLTKKLKAMYGTTLFSGNV